MRGEFLKNESHDRKIPEERKGKKMEGGRYDDNDDGGACMHA